MNSNDFEIVWNIITGWVMKNPMSLAVSLGTIWDKRRQSVTDAVGACAR